MSFIYCSPEAKNPRWLLIVKKPEGNNFLSYSDEYEARMSFNKNEEAGLPAQLYELSLRSIAPGDKAAAVLELEKALKYKSVSIIKAAIKSALDSLKSKIGPGYVLMPSQPLDKIIDAIEKRPEDYRSDAEARECIIRRAKLKEVYTKFIFAGKKP